MAIEVFEFLATTDDEHVHARAILHGERAGPLHVKRDDTTYTSVVHWVDAPDGAPQYRWWNVKCGDLYIAQFRGKRITNKDKELAIDLCTIRYGGAP